MMKTLIIKYKQQNPALTQILEGLVKLGVISSIEEAADISAQAANPSPSGDPYFDDPLNIEAVERGEADVKAGRYQEITLPELKKQLGL